jgi:hypothetical protein
MSSQHRSRGGRRILRRGASLAELLVLMSAAAAVLTMSSVLMHRIMHAQSKARLLADVERTSLRLARAFRGDVHLATSAAPGGGEGLLVRFTLRGDEQAEYRRDESGVLRVLHRGEQVISRDVFALPADAVAAVRHDGAHLVTLTIQSQIEEQPQPDKRNSDKLGEMRAFVVPVKLEVTAVLNRDALAATAAPPAGGQP